MTEVTSLAGLADAVQTACDEIDRLRDQRDALRAKLALAEKALAAIDAFIQHWQEDKRAGLKPTDVSLATGRARSRAALAAIREGRK